MSMRYRLASDDRLTIAGAHYRVLSQDADGFVFQCIDAHEVFQHCRQGDLVALLERPDVRLSRAGLSDRVAARLLRNETTWSSSLNKETRDSVVWKEIWVNALQSTLRAGKVVRTEASVAACLPTLEAEVGVRYRKATRETARSRAGRQVKDRDPPCAKTLLRWLIEYERGGATPLALLRKRRAPDTYRQKLPADVQEIVREAVSGYLSRKRPTVTMIVAEVKDRVVALNAQREAQDLPLRAIPSAATIYRRVKAIDPFLTTVQRDGADAARRKFGFYEGGVAVLHPLQRVEIDDGQIDVMTFFTAIGVLDSVPADLRGRFDVGRRWLCLAIDCATRCIVGFKLTDRPTWRSALDVVRMITEDKTAISRAAGCDFDWDQHGLPHTLVSDQGPNYIAPDFRMPLADLSICIETPAAGMPHLRGKVERTFGRIWSQFAARVPGRTFRDPTERGDYPSKRQAVLTDDELARHLVRFIVDEYHQVKHAGLGEETPANAWKRLAAEHGVSPPPDANSRRVAFGIELVRKVERHGLRAHGISYTCPELQAAFLHGRQRDYRLRIDPHDLGHVSVLIGNDWVPAKATSAAVAGMSLDELQVIVRERRNRFKEQAHLNDRIVARARSDMRAEIKAAAALRRVMPLEQTPEQAARLESELFLGLEIGPRESAAFGPPPEACGDLLADVIGPVAGPLSPDGPPAAPVSCTSTTEEMPLTASSSQNADGTPMAQSVGPASDAPKLTDTERSPARNRWTFDRE